MFNTYTKIICDEKVDNIFSSLKKIVTIDKLKICFNTPIGLYDRFSALCISDYDLIFTHKDTDNDGITITMAIHDYNNKMVDLGTLFISNSNKYKFMAFFQFSNIALYHIFGYDNDGKPYNGLHYLPMITKYFDLTFRSVTTLELAIDSNINVISRIRKYIKDYYNYDIVLNGKKIKSEKQTLDLYGEYYERTRKGITKKPTLYFHQKDNSYSLKVYDKAREIETSNKGYISDKKHLFRVELTIRNEDIKEFCNSLSKIDSLSRFEDYFNVLNYINDDEFLFLLFFKYTKRMIYFIDKRTKVRIYLTDILKVTEKFRDIIGYFQK